jgi:hypothetical protein
MEWDMADDEFHDGNAWQVELTDLLDHRLRFDPDVTGGPLPSLNSKIYSSFGWVH